MCKLVIEYPTIRRRLLPPNYGSMSDDDETDALDINPNHPLDTIEEQISTSTDTAEDSATMLRRTEEGNPTNPSSKLSRGDGRSLDQFLEDAYQDQPLLNKRKYWLIMVRYILLR